MSLVAARSADLLCPSEAQELDSDPAPAVPGEADRARVKVSVNHPEGVRRAQRFRHLVNQSNR